MKDNEYSCPENINYAFLARQFNMLSEICINISDELKKGVCSYQGYDLRVASTSRSNIKIKSDTGHSGKTGYSIYDVPEGTEIELEAPKKVQGNNGYHRFVSWAHMETRIGNPIFLSSNKKVSFNMGKEFQYVIARYEWIQEEVDPVDPYTYGKYSI